MTDVVYPLLIVLACVVIAFVVHHLTRPAPSQADLALPTRTVRTGAADHRLALANWHLEYGDGLLDFIDGADRTTSGVGATASPAVVDELLARATDEHPFPEMRAELGAMRAAVAAAADARARADVDAAEGHRQIYLAYREAWLERVWQFPGDAERIAELRGRRIDTPPTHDVAATPPA